MAMVGSRVLTSTVLPSKQMLFAVSPGGPDPRAPHPCGLGGAHLQLFPVVHGSRPRAPAASNGKQRPRPQSLGESKAVKSPGTADAHRPPRELTTEHARRASKSLQCTLLDFFFFLHLNKLKINDYFLNGTKRDK